MTAVPALIGSACETLIGFLRPTASNQLLSLISNGASPQPDEACLWSRGCSGAPAGRGETVTGNPGPVYEPPMRLVGLNRPPE